MSRITLLTASVAITLGLAALVNVASAADPAQPDFRQARMAYNEVKLKLTDAQKAEYKRLTETMKEASAPMRKMCEDKADPSKATTLPERMGQMQQMADIRSESMRKLVPAIKDFYATLSLEQQKIADDLMPGRGGKGGSGHHGGPGGGHGPMMMHH